MKPIITLIFLGLLAVSCGKEDKEKSPFKQLTKEQLETGEKIFNQYCSLCHTKEGPIQGIGAPMVGQKDDWKERLEKGLPELIKSVVNGFNAMPAKGTCSECSIHDIEYAVRFMLLQLEEKKS